MPYDPCPTCGEFVEIDDVYCPYCGDELEDDDDWLVEYRGPYDDEGDLAYSDVARGEDKAPVVSPALNNPAYPPRQS